MASLKPILSFIVALSILSAVAQPPVWPPQSILNAAETLASSGYTAMSLTLQVIAPTLPLPSSTHTALTIFSPPDKSFAVSGQPSLALLLLHFSPLSLPPSSLLSLPFSSTIPSLSPSKRLYITSEDAQKISINKVGISNSPIYDDGLVIVYAIDDFFDLNFTLSSSFDPSRTRPKSQSGLQCLKLEPVSRFDEASSVLKSRGYSIIASFMDLQIFGFFCPEVFSEDVKIKWTVFAPADEEMVQYSGDFNGYSSLFMRHLVPCRVGWADLVDMANGTVVSNNVKGFSMEVTKDENGESLKVNGVEIVFPEIFDNEWLVVHGIQGVIALPDSTEGEEEIEPEKFREKKAEATPDPDIHGEF
ncbi:putative fasciclin-like arabinogalactan protein 20 [Andrographis paniculata]|uniref:putative fasciclin-like arabinogalactan protein 20 n=1 Tax=Andrographis paniculata TaxID=175694 RepID=UPI0021E85802|nr:putative fasciclin-like arabinogalactan protein 20 [Andrographis paniculata]